MNFILSHKLSMVLTLCIVLRLGVLLAFPGVFDFMQTGQVHGSEAYDVYARNLLETGVFGRVPGEPDAAIPPLYAYVLAGLYALGGRGYLQIGAFHILLDVFSLALLYEIGRRLFPHGEWVGIGAALFFAGYPYLIFQNLTLIDTPLFILLLHAFVLSAILLRERDRFDPATLALAALAGLALGLATLTRPILPLLAVLVAVWFLLRRGPGQTILRLLPVALVSVLLVLPWLARNYTVYDMFVPMSLTAGSNFYQGNNPDVLAYMRAGYDPQWTGPDALTADPYSPAGDRERSELAWAYLRDNPDELPALFATKFLVHWSIDIFPYRNPVEGELPRLDYVGDALVEVGEDGSVELGGLPPGDPVAVYDTDATFGLGRLVHRYYFGTLLLLALAGVVVSLRRWRDVALLWFVQVSATVVYVVFHPSTRYRAPTDPLLFLFAAYLLVWVGVLVWRRLHPPPPASAPRAAAAARRR